MKIPFASSEQLSRLVGLFDSLCTIEKKKINPSEVFKIALQVIFLNGSYLRFICIVQEEIHLCFSFGTRRIFKVL